MVNFEHDPQARAGTHNPELERQVNELWNGMIARGRETSLPEGDYEAEAVVMARNALLGNILPVSPGSAHTVALYEKALRRSIAADIEFGDIDIDSDQARDWVYEGILAVESRHHGVRHSDFTRRDAAILKEARRRHRSTQEGGMHDTVDMSEGQVLRREDEKSLSAGLTLGYDPTDAVVGLLADGDRTKNYTPDDSSARRSASSHWAIESQPDKSN